MKIIEGEWSLLLAVVGITILGLGSWLQGMLPAVTGGSLVLLVPAIYTFALRIRVPTLSRPLFQQALFLYGLFLLTSLAGIGLRYGITAWNLGVLMVIPFTLTSFMCGALMLLFVLSPKETGTGRTRRALVMRVVLPVAGSLLLYTVAWSIGVTVSQGERSWMGTAFTSILFVQCLTTGLLLKGVPLVGYSELYETSRSLFRFFLPWTVVGSALEFSRGAWLMWWLTAATIVSLNYFAMKLASRASALQRG